MDASTIVSIVLSGVVAVSTVVYAFLTRYLVNETRALRSVQTDPLIDVVLLQHESSVNIFVMSVSNIGNGPARDIEFEFVPANEGEASRAASEYATTTRFLRDGLSYMSPGQTICTRFPEKQGLSVFDEIKDVEVVAKVSFAGNDGQKFSHEYTLSVANYLGVRRVFQKSKVTKLVEESLEVLKRVNNLTQSGALKVQIIETQVHE